MNHKEWLNAAGNRAQVSGMPLEYANHYSTSTFRHSHVDFNEKNIVANNGKPFYERQIALNDASCNV